MFYDYGGYPPGHIYEFDHYKVVVGKENLFFDGKNHRRLLLESHGGYYYESDFHEWVEGYGSLISRGFLNPVEIDGILNGDSYSFNCVLENGTPVFSPANCYCNPHDNIDGLIVREPEISISNFTVMVESDESYLAEIFDITGKLLHKEFSYNFV